MKLLFIAPYVPSRVRVRPFHFIQELAKRHEVHVLALEEPGGDLHEGVDLMREAAASFEIVPHSKIGGYFRCAAALATPHPMCTAYSRSAAMAAAVSDITARVRFDAIHIEHLRAASFAPVGAAPTLFDSVDCLTSLFRSMARSKKNVLSKLITLREALCLSRTEPRALAQFDSTIVTTDSERRKLIVMNPRLSPHVVPNGVDTDYFCPLGVAKKPRRIVFSGKMSYLPNAQAAVWFANEVFPILRSHYPDAEFLIVGSNPPRQVLELAEMPGITVTGYVPDVRPYLDSSALAVAPMQVAVGIQNKILESMAMGLPVIATRGTCRAFGDSCPGILTADNAEETARECIRLIDNPALTTGIGRMGRERVLQDFTWTSSMAKLESLYSQLASERKVWTQSRI